MQRKESVLIAAYRGSPLASPAGLLLTSSLGSGPVPGRTLPPQVSRKNQRQQEQEGTAEEAPSGKGEGAGCRRMWAWPQVTGGSSSPTPSAVAGWHSSPWDTKSPWELVDDADSQAASSRQLWRGPGSSIFIGSSSEFWSRCSVIHSWRNDTKELLLGTPCMSYNPTTTTHTSPSLPPAARQAPQKFLLLHFLFCSAKGMPCKGDP